VSGKDVFIRYNQPLRGPWLIIITERTACFGGGGSFKLTYTASMPELMTAQDIMYLAEDIVADNNIQAIYKPAELSLEVV